MRVTERPTGGYRPFDPPEENLPAGVDPGIWRQVGRTMAEQRRSAYRTRYWEGWTEWWHAGEDEARDLVRTLRVVRAVNIVPRIPDDHRLP